MTRSRSPRALAPALSLAALAVALLAPSAAFAFERQWHAGADAGYSVLMDPKGTALHGFGGGLHLTYGMSDTINLLLDASVTVHPATTDAEGNPVEGSLLTGGSVGLGYVFDILQWVPWIGATAGGYYDANPSNPGARLGLGVPFGLDYQLSRSFAIGVTGDYRLLFLDPNGVSQRISAFVRVEYIWGF